MSVGRSIPSRWPAILVAVLCLGVWLASGWHVAVEAHVHDHHAVSDDHEHHHHDRGQAPAEEHAPHQARDHEAPDCTPWSAPVLVPSSSDVPIAVVAPTPAPRRPRTGDDSEPPTDPPRPPGRPRAPPVA